MWRYSYSVILFLVIPSILLAQKKIKIGDIDGYSALRKEISRNLLKFHDEELLRMDKSVVVIAVISVLPKGKIDSINFSNTRDTKLTSSITDAIRRTQSNWLRKRRKYNVVIPFYILINGYHSQTIEIETGNLVPVNEKLFPVEGLILEPI